MSFVGLAEWVKYGTVGLKGTPTFSFTQFVFNFCPACSKEVRVLLKNAIFIGKNAV